MRVRDGLERNIFPPGLMTPSGVFQRAVTDLHRFGMGMLKGIFLRAIH